MSIDRDKGPEDRWRPAKGLILGVDLDGVCADFYGRMREIAAEWFETPVEGLTQEVTFDLHEWGILTSAHYESLHRFAVTQRDLFKTAGLIPGARKYLRKLSNEGVRIRIITHRLFMHHLHRTAVEQTIDWLDHNGIPYWDLCFVRDKEQVGADVYVEDGPENVKGLRESGCYTICFANSTNRAIGEPRAESWDQVYQLVKRYAATNGAGGRGRSGGSSG